MARKVRESTVDRSKRLAKIVARRQVDAILRLRETMDIHPWDETGEMSPQERISKFVLVQDDEPFWTELVEADRQLFHLRTDRVPKRLWQESVSLYKKAQKKGVTLSEAIEDTTEDLEEEGEVNDGTS